MEKSVAIIGTGISGLLACKYAVEKGFQPVVFEAQHDIGGVWRTTMESTKLQNPKDSFQFSDFPWPSSVKEMHPSHTQVLDYIKSYAQHFNLLPYIRFNRRVISLDYIGVSDEEMSSCDLWGKTGKAFNSKGKWQLKVQNCTSLCIEDYQFEFVILCIGRYSDFPNIPEFPHDSGSGVFNGKLVHSMEYSSMDRAKSVELIKGKRVAIVGAQKSALDVAAECAGVNGVVNPCTMIMRTVNWMVPNRSSKFNAEFLFFSRFPEFMFHKPGESIWLRFLATLLSPLRWVTSKIVETYLRWKLPLKKYAMVPNHSFVEQLHSCQIVTLPDNFYEKVAEGSITLKKSQCLGFCHDGLIIDGEAEPLQADVVILATGFRGDEKLKNIFTSPFYRNCIKGSATRSPVPLYRQIIQPRIPQLAVIGYPGTVSNLQGSEIRCQWLVHFLCGGLELPNIAEMEKEILQWENYMKRYAGKSHWMKSCIAIPIWYNDQLCRDMGCEPRRKKGLLAELFQPYGPLDYAGLTSVRGT